MTERKAGSSLFISSRHLTRDELVSYARHTLDANELHRMEMHLVDCEFCSDALKGISELKDAGMLFEVLHELRRRARRKKHLRRRIFSQAELIAVFAVVFLILFLLLMSILFFSKVS